MKTLLMTMLCAGAVWAQGLTYERILNPDREPGNWLTYSGNYAGHRHSPLTEIHEGNVNKLKVAWVYQTNSLQKFETTPIVVDGIIYISEPPSNAAAIDARTGRALWRYRRQLPDDLRVCCGQVNRGVAVLGNLVYLGTLDGHLLALDARTGAIRWDTVVADYKLGYSITVAPLAVRDKIVIGVAGGEYGARGFLDAYHAQTGKQAWRFWTVPGPGEPGNETWKGDSWKVGAADTWVTGAFDPETNLIYWGTGNPGPDWNGDVRLGDNLYSDSLIAVDADRGKLKWYFQFTPHDVHDWDATEVPVLVDELVRGEKRKLLLFPNRNAFYYVLDRVTGKFLLGKEYAKQTWTKGLDDNGRPIRIEGTTPTLQGVKVWPSVAGANNWYSPAYSPVTGLFYVAVRDSGSVYYTGEAVYKPGERFDGGGYRAIPGEEEQGFIRAYKPASGEVAWEYKLHSAPWSGVLSTAGNLVFGATNEGQIFALNAKTGAPLWRFQATSLLVRSNPITYAVDGKQYLAMALGNSLYAFALE
ncbi:MAG: PQQ-dependent dehydrogenase, methanol/ethanol family [Bryobacter sp.]|jgi:alcohol dehydrogenase (cytochrome c)|nr:PQQ-dependent dehydrogenase, methanol/ethanol family [Bryobacter sp. CoA8 C33]